MSSRTAWEVCRERPHRGKHLPEEKAEPDGCAGQSVPCVGGSQPSVQAQLLSGGAPTPEASQRAWLTYWKEGSAGPSTVTGTGVCGEEVGSLATN